MDLSQAFDPESFRQQGHRVVDRLADYLRNAREASLPVLPAVPPDQLLGEVPAEFPEQPTDDLLALVNTLLARSNHLHHPGYIGHQVAVTLPWATLIEATTALLNNGMAVYEMGQVHTVMERHVVRFLADRLGFDARAGGVLTHGGSLGNLTALLAARQAKAPFDAWEAGDDGTLSVLVSDQSHYCVDRALRVLGQGRAGAQVVATDDDYRMTLAGLEQALRRAREAGRTVFAVVANAGSTATGSIDPLAEIAEFCAAEDLWLHVDGAHGASMVLSDTHRPRLAGIERADSVVWDLHKLMMLPALNTAVLFRDQRHGQAAFAQQASYLFADRDPEENWFDIGQRTLECTKRGMGVTAYIALRTLGTGLFGKAIDATLETTRQLAALLEDAPDFETAGPPDTNILCFRFLPDGAVDLDAVQARVRAAVVAGGQLYLVQTRLRGVLFLRVTLMNPETAEAQLHTLLDQARTAWATG